MSWHGVTCFDINSYVLKCCRYQLSDWQREDATLPRLTSPNEVSAVTATLSPLSLPSTNKTSGSEDSWIEWIMIPADSCWDTRDTDLMSSWSMAVPLGLTSCQRSIVELTYVCLERKLERALTQSRVPLVSNSACTLSCIYSCRYTALFCVTC